MKLKNIPNILSVIRILLVFVFIYLFFSMAEPYVALLIFLLAGATDVVDGYLARRNNWVTTLGKILDPVADKLMQCTVLVCLAIKQYIPIWFMLPFFIKEALTLFMGFLVIKRRNVAVVSKWYGKFTVCLFYATIALAILLRDFLSQNLILYHAMFVPAVVFAVIAMVAYIKHYAYLKNEEPQQGKIINIRKEK